MFLLTLGKRNKKAVPALQLMFRKEAVPAPRPKFRGLDATIDACDTHPVDIYNIYIKTGSERPLSELNETQLEAVKAHKRSLIQSKLEESIAAVSQ